MKTESDPIKITAGMEEARQALRDLIGEDKYRKVIGGLLYALKKASDPFELATSAAVTAGERGQTVGSWQLLAAACEIAEETAEIRRRN